MFGENRAVLKRTLIALVLSLALGLAALYLVAHLGDDLRVHALREQERRAGVPEVVEAYVGQHGTPQQRLEVAGHKVRVVCVPADGVRENEATILPAAVRS